MNGGNGRVSGLRRSQRDGKRAAREEGRGKPQKISCPLPGRDTGQSPSSGEDQGPEGPGRSHWVGSISGQAGAQVPQVVGTSVKMQKGYPPVS